MGFPRLSSGATVSLYALNVRAWVALTALSASGQAEY